MMWGPQSRHHHHHHGKAQGTAPKLPAAKLPDPTGPPERRARREGRKGREESVRAFSRFARNPVLNLAAQQARLHPAAPDASWTTRAHWEDVAQPCAGVACCMSAGHALQETGAAMHCAVTEHVTFGTYPRCVQSQPSTRWTGPFGDRGLHVARSCTRCRTCLIRRMECRPNRLRRTMQKTGSMVLTTTAGSSIIRCAVCGQTLLCNKPIEPNPASVALEGVGSVLQAIVKVKGALEAVEANKKSCGRLAAQWARMDECLRKQQQLIGQVLSYLTPLI